MNRSIVKGCAALALFGANLLAAGIASAQANAEQVVAGIDALQGEARQQALVAGAKKEGELMLYNVMPSIDMAPVMEAFTKKYGIAVKTWRASSEQVLQKVMSEAGAGRFVADVIENNGPEMEALHREKLLLRIDSPTEADVMPEAVPAHREWVGNTIDIFVQAYNTDLVRKEDLPKTYRDLLDPKWKGKLAIESADQHWFAVLARELGEQSTVQLFRDIVDTNGISVRNGHSLISNLVASGEIPLALTVLNYTPPQLKQKGAPIESFMLAPHIAYFRGIGVTKKAPHPHAALLYYEFLQSEEGQQILLARSKIPVNRKVGSLDDKSQLVFIDPGEFLDKNAQWIRLYEQTVTKRQK